MYLMINQIGKAIFSLAIVFLLAQKTAVAQDKSFKPLSDTNAFSERYSAHTQKLNSLSSDITQVKYLTMMESEIVSKGKFYFKKPSKIKLSYTSPIVTTIVFDNGKIIIQEGKKISKMDASANSLLQTINEMLLETIKGDVLKSTKYQIAYLESAAQFRLDLTPVDKEIKKYISKIKITIAKDKLTTENIEITELSGDYTKMKFENSVENATIEDAVFVVK